MRDYLIEDLQPGQLALICNALKARGLSGSLEGIFYLPLPDELLTETQRTHAAECGPHIFALEALDGPGEPALKLELLVRARGKLRCECVAYATPAQREYVMDFLDAFIRQLDIAV